MTWVKNKVAESESGCLEWTAARQVDGYGVVRFNGRMHHAHRLSLGWHLGRWLEPNEMACHTCDNRVCVNAKHLFLGDHEANMADMVSKGRRPLGERKALAKLDDESVRQIRLLVNLGATQRWVANALGTSWSTVWKVVAGKTWTHVVG